MDTFTIPSKRIVREQGAALVPGRHPGKRPFNLSRTIGEDRVFVNAPEGPLILKLATLKKMIKEVEKDE